MLDPSSALAAAAHCLLRIIRNTYSGKLSAASSNNQMQSEREEQAEERPRVLDPGCFAGVQNADRVMSQ
jgi:hypothetical protein